MKTQHFSKKLSLSKETIVNFEKISMDKIYGGAKSDYTDCALCGSAFPCTSFDIPCASRPITCTCF